MDKIIKTFFKDLEPNKILSYEEFLSESEQKVNNVDENSLEGIDKKYHDYRKINIQRTNRIAKTFKPNSEIMQVVKAIDKKIVWFVITEDWCGDSAQNLPYIYSYIQENPKMEMKVILRDSNLEAIDNYFTEVNPRSIPKIIGFDENGNELFTWGPRPKFAQDLVQQLKAEGYSREEFNNQLHLWYGRNRGKELEKELIEIFQKLAALK